METRPITRMLTVAQRAHPPLMVIRHIIQMRMAVHWAVQLPMAMEKPIIRMPMDVLSVLQPAMVTAQHTILIRMADLQELQPLTEVEQLITLMLTEGQSARHQPGPVV